MGFRKRFDFVHCHNDFGLAVANTIAGFENGASEAQTTIMGLGERAGNASFEETAMSLYALYQIPMNIITQKIFPTAKLIESYCGGKVKIGRLQPLIGQNAFAHEAGIHAHAMIKNARTYEPITPQLIGISRSDSVIDILKQSIKFGKHMGTSFLYPLKIAGTGSMKIAPTEKALINKAISIMKQTRLDYFYVSELIREITFDSKEIEALTTLIIKRIFNPYS
ncbi:unnamed protein product [marine sediment metagenome]|uniref:Pyruvate carboxyltransferase domain-containing protein n=1 Tax=marine sediment metagenome TaxID=412755 RepID=X1C635_9ZZZZ